MKTFGGQFIYKTSTEQKLLEEDTAKFGVFPVEKLFNSREWFQFISLSPKLRPTAVGHKLKSHPNYIAKDITYTQNGEVYKLLVVDRASDKVLGCLSLEDICRITFYTGANYRDQAAQLQQLKENREELINEARAVSEPITPQSITSVESSKLDYSAQTQNSSAPNSPSENVLLKIRKENALALCPLSNINGDVEHQCKVFRRIYHDFDRLLSRIESAASNDRDFSTISDYMAESGELTTVALCSLAKDPDMFESFKDSYNSWAGNPLRSSNAVLAALIMDPTTTMDKLGDLLPRVDFKGFPMGARKFYSSPNAVLYAMDLFARNRMSKNDTPPTPGDLAFMAGMRQYMDLQGSTFKDVMDAILKSPLKSLYPTYYDALCKRDLLDPSGMSVSSRIKSNIVSDGPKWLKGEMTALTKWLRNPPPVIDLEKIDSLDVNL